MNTASPARPTGFAIAPFLFLLMLAVAAHADSPAAAAKGSKAESDAPKTHTVAKGSITPDVSGDGVFEPVDPHEVRVRPKSYAGELLVLSSAPHGAAVKAGDVLLEIDPDSINKEIAAAENELALATANAKKAKEDVRLGEEADELALVAAEKELQNAADALKWFQTAEGPDMLRQADINVKMQKDGIEDQEDELDQLKKMYKTEDLTTATADIVIKRAVRQVARSREMLGIGENQSKKIKQLQHPQTQFNFEQAVKKAQVALEQLKVSHAQSKVARQTALVSADIALAKAKEKSAELKADLAELKSTAPLDGVAYWGQMTAGAWQNPNPKALEKGEKLPQQQVLLTLVSPAKLRAAIALPEPKLASVKTGQKATITPKLLPQAQYSGTVSKIAKTPAPLGSGNGYKVEIELAGVEMDPRLAPGMTATVKVEAEKVDGVLLVPASAVEGGNKVKVVPDAKLEGQAEGKPQEQEREVVTGRSDGKMVEIVRGLVEGEKVVVKE